MSGVRIDETSNSEIVFYSVKDESLGFFAFPFTARSDHDAMAMLRNAVEPGSALHRFPDHFSLYKVGVFNDQEGTFYHGRPLKIISLKALVSTITDDGTIVEDPADEDPADEDPADEDPADEDPADEDPVDEDPADEDPAGEDPVLEVE